jgi:hypothetical protein
MIEPFYIGLIGMFLLLISFILNLFKNFSPNSKIYLLLNILGAGFLSYYSYISNTFIFLILNVLWTLISLYRLIKVIRGKI